MCKEETGNSGEDAKTKDADEGESKERLLQAKRLWNLRWCYNWYSRKCELEEKVYRRRQVNYEDMLLTSNLNLYIIQQVLRITSNDSTKSNDSLFGISETEEVVENITTESSLAPDNPSVEKKKYKLVKTPLHYIRVLKNKVSRKQNRYGKKATLDKDQGEFPLLKKSPGEELDQRSALQSGFDKSCDLIDFVSTSRSSDRCGLLALQCPACQIQQVVKAMGLKLQTPLNPEDSEGPSFLLRAQWEGDSDGEKVVYVKDVSASEKFPRASTLQLLEESTHSPLCIYYIVRTIVRGVISSHAFNFLKNCKKRNAIENNLTNILRHAQGSHFLMSSGWRKELQSSPSCPAQLHSYMTINVPYGAGEIFTSSYERGMSRDWRERGLPNELNFPWCSKENVTAGTNRRPSEYLSPHPQLYCARSSYPGGIAHDPEKSKTL